MSGEPQNTTPVSTPTTPPPPKTKPTDTKSPGLFSKFWEFIEYHLKNDRPHLKAAWISVAILVCGFWYLGYWFRGHLDQQSFKGKDDTITAKEATIQYETARANGLQAEHDKLFKENTELKTANAELTSPLKKRTLILSAQLKQFAEGCTNTAYPQIMDHHNAYDARFYDAAQRANFVVEAEQKFGPLHRVEQLF